MARAHQQLNITNTNHRAKLWQLGGQLDAKKAKQIASALARALELRPDCPVVRAEAAAAGVGVAGAGGGGE